MNMLSFLSSKTVAVVSAMVLLLPILLVGSNVGYSFAYPGQSQHQNAQLFIAGSNSNVSDASREEFWFPTMIWPVANPVVSSGFGHRDSSCRLCSTDHRGTDFTPGRGSEIFAVMDGTVIEAGTNGAYGTVVVIEHPNGWKTLYAHMTPGSQTVSIGDTVIQGKTIGLVGSSGVATGAHLHFEIIVNGVQRNPLPILNEWTQK